MDPCQSPPSHNSSISDINHPKDYAFVSSTHDHDVPVNLDLPLSLSVGLGLDDNNDNNNGGEYSDTSIRSVFGKKMRMASTPEFMSALQRTR